MKQKPKDNQHRTVKFVLQLAAGATFVIGLSTLFAPQLIVRWFDGFGGPNLHLVRFLGTALIGFSVTNWLYSQFDDLTIVVPAIYGNLTSLGLALIVDSLGLAFHKLNRAAWLILIVHIIFIAAFSYCVVLIKSSERRQDI